MNQGCPYTSLSELCQTCTRTDHRHGEIVFPTFTVSIDLGIIIVLSLVFEIFHVRLARRSIIRLDKTGQIIDRKTILTRYGRQGAR